MHDVAPHRWSRDVAPAFAKLVHGKPVAIVGPARTILGKKQGAHIDAHDLVVRFNDTFDLPSRRQLREDIGSRTDILYCNQVILKEVGARALAQPGLQAIVCTNNSLSFSLASEPAIARHTPPPTVRVVQAASATLSTWLRGKWARTGMVGVFGWISFGGVG